MKHRYAPFALGELDLPKVEPRHSYSLKPPREFCLVSRPGEFRGAAAGKTIQFNLRAWRRIGNSVKEAIAVTIQANDQLYK